jgi:hypothetical protein
VIIALFVNGGFGDAIDAIKASFLLKEKGHESIIYFLARDDVFLPYYDTFGKDFIIKQLDDRKTEQFLTNETQWKEFWTPVADEAYFIWPDLLFRHKYSFNPLKFGIHYQTFKTLRVLTKKWTPNSSFVYVGLVTSTDGYLYHDIPLLLQRLGESLPSHKFFFPLVQTWAGRELDLGNFDRDFPENIVIHRQPKFQDQLDLIKQCIYGIYTDNGVMHYAGQLGQPRLLLDPRFGAGRNSLPWIARWRTTTDESIPISRYPEEIVKLVATNLNIPQTTLIPRMAVLNNLYEDWSRELIFKY